MSQRLLALSLCLFGVATFAANLEAQIPGARLEPGALSAVDGLLLLKNGETLEGSISRSGDYYLVVTAQAEIQVRTRDAEAVCRDLDEVLARKRSLINARSADEHLDLAQWCIDKQLYGQAARELTEAYRIDDIHPRLRLLEMRMKAAMAAPKEIVAAAKPAANGPTDEELARDLSTITAEGLHEYTVSVQPLLMNYGASAGCHGPRSTSAFQLERIYLNENSDPRSVKINLARVLKLVDRQAPSTSKLLTVPISPHGGGKRAVFHAHNAEHYRMIASWVGRIAQSTRRTAAPSTAAVNSAGPLSQRLPIAPPTASPTTTATPPATPTTAAATNANPTGAASTTAAPSAAASGADPFDPTEFNGGRTASP